MLHTAKGIWDDFNLWVGTKISVFLSSMGGFWIILMLTVVPLVKDRPHGLIAWTMYVIQTIFQGAALPLLGYVADRGSKEVGKLIREMHDMILGRINERIDNIENSVTKQNEELKVLLKEIHEHTRGKK
jgi:hypothetical protein